MKIQYVSMSTSTIFIKRPINYRTSIATLKEKYKKYTPVLSAVMWTVSAVYGAAQSNFNGNITGVTLYFPVYQIMLMLIASGILCKGLANKNILLILPWIGATGYSLYVTHYLELLQTLTAVIRVKKLSWLPWCNLFINIFLLVIRLTLTIRVLQLCIHLWFKKKLKEMKIHPL